jgi:hypothetical protein
MVNSVDIEEVNVFLYCWFKVLKIKILEMITIEVFFFLNHIRLFKVGTNGLTQLLSSHFICLFINPKGPTQDRFL